MDTKVSKKTITIPSHIKGLVFDLDGTLVNSMPLHYEAYNHCLLPYNVEYDYETFQSRGGIPTKDTLLMIAADHQIENFDVEQALTAKRNYFDSQLNKVEPISVTFDLMKAYHGVLPMAIGTGSNRKTVTEVYELFSLADYIPLSVTANDVENFKPHPETFLKCAELIGIAPEYCMVFEDGLPGIEAAKTAGMEVIDIREYL